MSLIVAFLLFHTHVAVWARPPKAQAPAGSSVERISSPAAQQSEIEREPEGFRWGPALLQSFLFLSTEHGFRMTHAKTRRELAGPFFRNYWSSVRGIRGWNDGDSVFTNYVAHPMQGAVAGFIQIHNDPGGLTQQFGRSRQYWHSRLKAMGWAAIYSTQFEIGPVSEATIGRHSRNQTGGAAPQSRRPTPRSARHRPGGRCAGGGARPTECLPAAAIFVVSSIGHVGKRAGTGGLSDLVVTPPGGLGMIALEDALDLHVIRKWEMQSGSLAWRRFYRIVLNPQRTFANLLRFKKPWHRDTRRISE